MRRNPDRATDLLESVPDRCRRWRSDDSGRVLILVPRYGNSRLGMWIEKKVGRPPLEVVLDDIGSFTWRSCDGIRTVAEIAVTLSDEFGDRVDPVVERLGLFFEQLVRNGHIRLRPREHDPT